jgi:hypothetical protein
LDSPSNNENTKAHAKSRSRKDNAKKTKKGLAHPAAVGELPQRNLGIQCDFNFCVPKFFANNPILNASSFPLRILPRSASQII